jgi:hypothetical protein
VNLSEIVRQRTGVELRELAGSTLAGEIPLSDALVNRMLAERLAHHAQVAAVRVQAQQNDTVAVQVVPRARLMPALNITARIERQPEFPQHPMLLLRWSMPAAGPLALFAAPVLAFFKAMPQGIRMDGDRIAVDVRELLHSRGLDDILALIRKLEIHTKPGGFALRFEMGINA